MNHMKRYRLPLLIIAGVLLLGVVQLARICVRETATIAETAAPTIVIDAGHGGEDGGASTEDGVPESQINLAIALRLNDLFHSMGYDTSMIRTTDVSIYSAGAQTISEKKISDLKNRVALIAQTEHALLVSVHQNTFPESQYSGAQVFSAPTDGSARLAEIAQMLLCEHVDPDNHRKSKQIPQSVYLMNQISCTGILAECGFLSNRAEATALQTAPYQIRLATALCCAINQFLGEQSTNEI